MVMNGTPPTEANRGTVSITSFSIEAPSNFCFHQTPLEDLLKALPSRRQATTQAATTRVLAAKALDEIYLMETPSWMFREEKAKTTFRKFCKRLKGIEKEMVQRNRGLKVPYTVLLPSKMPAGITI